MSDPGKTAAVVAELRRVSVVLGRGQDRVTALNRIDL